jgi:hypothetical protein
MSEELKHIQLPIDGRRFETARGTFRARLRTKPDFVIQGDKMSSTICHNIVFENEQGQSRDMRFWLPPEFVVYDRTMENVHRAALEQIHAWLESEDFDSDEQDYWLNEQLKLEPFTPFGNQAA